MKNDVALCMGCVAGASRKEQNEEGLREVGVGRVVAVDARSDLNVYVDADGGDVEGVGCCEPVKVVASNGCCGGGGGGGKKDGGVVQDLETDLKDVDLNEWAGKHCLLGVLLSLLIRFRLIQNLCC
jgi:arsenite methyltransferase